MDSISFIQSSLAEIKEQVTGWIPVIEDTKKTFKQLEDAGIDTSDLRGLRHTAMADLKIVLRKIDLLQVDISRSDQWNQVDTKLFEDRFMDFHQHICHELDSFQKLSDKLLQKSAKLL